MLLCPGLPIHYGRFCGPPSSNPNAGEDLPAAELPLEAEVRPAEAVRRAAEHAGEALPQDLSVAAVALPPGAAETPE